MKLNIRQEAILELIEQKEIATQGELTKLLNERGIKATQATVSRDITELGLIKTAGSVRKFRYAQKAKDEKMTKLAKIFKESVLSVQDAENLIVVKTYDGNANAASVLIDNLDIPQIIGTIAGDDTILIVVKTKDGIPSVLKTIKEYL